MQKLLAGWIAIFRGRHGAYLASIPLLLALLLLALSEDASYAWTHARLELLLCVLSAVLLILQASLKQRSAQKDYAHTLAARDAELQALGTRTKNLLAAARQVAVIVTNAQGQILSFSAGAQAIFGYTEQEALGLNAVTQLPLGLQLEARPAPPGASEAPMERLFQRKNGDSFTGELRHATAMHAAKQELEHLLIIVDVSERHALLSNLQERKQFLKLLTQRIPNMLYQYHMRGPGDGYFSYCSSGIQRLFELEPEEVMHKSYADSPLFKRVLPEDMAVVSAATVKSMQQGQPWQADFRVQLPQRGVRWLRGESYAERQPDNSFVWYGSFIDITALKDSEATLRKQALTDELTGVHNRRQCMQSLDGLVEMAKRYAQPFALILFDLDKFKTINDRWGHDTGDLVLQQSCECIAARLRSTDLLCRIGGEELVVLCPHTDASTAQHLAQALCDTLAAYAMPVVGTVTASFGVAAWRDGEPGDVVLQRADAAAYRAKQNGRNRVEVD